MEAKLDSSNRLLEKSEFRRVLFKTLLLPLISAFVLALLASLQVRTLLDWAEWVHISERIMTESRQIQKILGDLENGFQTFALSGSSSGLDTYKKAKSMLDQAYLGLSEHLQDRPEEMAAVSRASALTQEWIKRFSEVEIVRLSSGKKILNLTTGRELMAEIEEDLNFLASAAAGMREKRLNRTQTFAKFLSGGGVILAISIGFFLALSARRNIFVLNDVYERTLEERNHLLSKEIHRSKQLQGLTELAVNLNEIIDMQDRVRISSEQARQILLTDTAVTLIFPRENASHAPVAASISGNQNGWEKFVEKFAASETFLKMKNRNRPVRISGDELAADPVFAQFRQSQLHPLSPTETLAAPIPGKSGQTIGWMILSGRLGESFSIDDEYILSHIAQLTGVAVENSQLFQVEQNAVKTRDEFLSIASHELKTPLTSLKLQLHLFERFFSNQELNDRDRLAGYLKQSKKSTNRLAHLIDDMLDISKISAGKLSLLPEPFDLSELVKEVVERLTPLNCPPIMIECSCPGPVWANLDKFRIDQVLTNLLSNAVKYGDGKPVFVSLAKKSNEVILNIRDQGIGIAKEDQERIFNRFERVSENTSISGMGLGLYITRQIVDMHNGHLDVKSEIGKGSTFTLTLPLERACKEEPITA